MIIRVILIRPKPEMDEGRMYALLARFHTLQQYCSGILDIQMTESSHPNYPYGVVFRYANPLLRIGGLFHENYYQTLIDDLQSACMAVLDFDIGSYQYSAGWDDRIENTPTGVSQAFFAYGNFKPNVEERLRQLVRLWTRGNAQPLTDEMELLDYEDPYGLDSTQLDLAIQAEFGVSVATVLEENFGNIVQDIEEQIKDLQVGLEFPLVCYGFGDPNWNITYIGQMVNRVPNMPKEDAIKYVQGQISTVVTRTVNGVLKHYGITSIRTGHDKGDFTRAFIIAVCEPIANKEPVANKEIT